MGSEGFSGTPLPKNMGLKDGRTVDFAGQPASQKASKVVTNLTECTIRDCAPEHDLVDVKVCAVDEIWLGLKVVIRKEHRAKYAQKSEGQ